MGSYLAKSEEPKKEQFIKSIYDVQSFVPYGAPNTDAQSDPFLEHFSARKMPSNPNKDRFRQVHNDMHDSLDLAGQVRPRYGPSQQERSDAKKKQMQSSRRD